MRRLILSLIVVFILPITAFAANPAYRPDKSGDEVLQSLISTKAQKFAVHTFSDDVTGLAIQYGVYLPESYSTEQKYPVVFFMADASAAGKPVNYSLTQGYGALVWPDECIVIVPAYPIMILDDHDGFVKTDYVELTGRFVRWAVKNYSIDSSRVYATGQSMGCMTFLVLAAKYPDMFSSCLFVSGQWDISELRGLIGQRFVYTASLGDEKASKGQQEVIDMFRNEGAEFTWDKYIDAYDRALNIPAWQKIAMFFTFRKGVTLPAETTGKYSEHMTSFDYTYRIKPLREWLLAQRKETKHHE